MSWVIVGMAAAGLLKSEMIDKPQAAKQRKLAAETQRNSPWTGLKAGPVKEADPFGTALQFGTTGAMIDSGQKSNNTPIQPVSTQPSYTGSPGGSNYSGANTQYQIPEWMK